MRWREHLENMEALREGVHLRSMAQKDPLVEYTADGERDVHRARDASSAARSCSTSSTPSSTPEQAQQQLAQQSQTTNGNLQYEHETSAGAAAMAVAGGGEAVAAGVPSSAGVVLRPCARASTRSSAATTRAGAARARSSRSATAPSWRTDEPVFGSDLTGIADYRMGDPVRRHEAIGHPTSRADNRRPRRPHLDSDSSEMLPLTHLPRPYREHRRTRRS